MPFPAMRGWLQSTMHHALSGLRVAQGRLRQPAGGSGKPGLHRLHLANRGALGCCGESGSGSNQPIWLLRCICRLLQAAAAVQDTAALSLFAPSFCHRRLAAPALAPPFRGTREHALSCRHITVRSTELPWLRTSARQNHLHSCRSLLHHGPFFFFAFRVICTCGCSWPRHTHSLPKFQAPSTTLEA